MSTKKQSILRTPAEIQADEQLAQQAKEERERITQQAPAHQRKPVSTPVRINNREADILLTLLAGEITKTQAFLQAFTPGEQHPESIALRKETELKNADLWQLWKKIQNAETKNNHDR